MAQARSPGEFTSSQSPEFVLSTLRKGIEEFNRGYFFQSHETLEEAWQTERGTVRDFYKGIIHIAAGFVHLIRGNYHGTLAKLGSGVRYLEPYQPFCLGVDVAGLVADARRVRAAIEALGPERFREFDRWQAPKIRFTPPAGDGR